MFYQKLARLILSASLTLGFLLHAWGEVQLPFLEQLENTSYDMRLNFTMPGDVDHRIVIVDIDEKSLAVEGRWPWGRDKVAKMVDMLFDQYFVSVLGFDVLFAEEDNSSGMGILDQFSNSFLKDDQRFQTAYQRFRPFLDRDMIFSRSLQDKPVVLGYFFKTENQLENNQSKGALPAPIARLEGPLLRIPFTQAQGFSSTLGILQESAFGAGFIDKPLLDSDGVIRKVQLVQEYQGELYEAFSIAIVRAVMGNPPVSFDVAEGYESEDYNRGLEWINIEGFSIPVDEAGATLVPYRGMAYSFPYVSATDVINGQVDASVLEGAIVLVGTSAAGLFDLRSAPVQSVFPGVEVHANLISGILDGTIKQNPGYIEGVEIFSILITALVLALALPRLPPLLTIPIALAVMAIHVSINFYFWTNNIVLPLAAPIIFISLYYMIHVSFGFFVEQKDKRRLAAFFRFYVPPELVKEMVDRQDDFDLSGESREMTVLFADIRGFTSLSESMTPRQLTGMINTYLTHMTEEIHYYRGTIDKFIGDAIMAFWGAPLPDKNHASNAVHGALAMLRKLPEINQKMREKGWPEISIGVGLNTGTMNVGNMGSEYRMAYTVLGDAVNLGSRLEGLTKTYGVPIVVSHTTMDAAGEFEYRDVDIVKVMGKDEPVQIYQPVGLVGQVSRETLEELDDYHEALDCYRNRDWIDADEGFRELLNVYPGNKLYEIYLERISHYIEQAPEDNWNGVYVHTSK